MRLSLYQLLGSVRDRSADKFTPFKWKCNGRHHAITEYADEKRCRYCEPIEIPEEDHPLFWRGNTPIYNGDMTWR